MSTPTRAQILGLYRRYLVTAQSFSSYNFRTYFLRRSRDLFRSALLPPQEAATSSPFSKAGVETVKASPPTLLSPSPSALSAGSSSSSSPSTPTTSDTTNPVKGETSDDEKLKIFYQTAVKDLEALKRAALLNRIYEGEKLVVEKPHIIVSGGGAGAEAATGGSGQPDAAAQSSGGAPKSS